MSKSKNRSNHKEKVNNFKLKNKAMSTTTQQQESNEPIRNTPIWKGEDKIEMNGAEFEHIFNYISNVNGAYMAIQSVMNKNIINGTIKMQYEKLNPNTGQYETLTGEDAKPYEDEFDTMVNAVKSQNNGSQPTKQEEKVERLDAIVNENGVPFSEEDRGRPNLTIA